MTTFSSGADILPRWAGPSAFTSKAASEEISAGVDFVRALDSTRRAASARADRPGGIDWTSSAVASAAGAAAAPAPASIDKVEPFVRQILLLKELGLKVDLTGAGKKVMAADGTDIYALNVTPPADLVKQAKEVAVANGKVSDAQRIEIVCQAGDVRPFLFGACGLHPLMHVATVELVDTALQALGGVIHPLKQSFAVPRPHTQSTEIFPLLKVPGHFSFPGGHAAQAHLVAALLAAFAGLAGLEKVLSDIADVIADNRVRAGLHYVNDGVAGAALGRALANHLIGVAGGQTPGWAWLRAQAEAEWR